MKKFKNLDFLIELFLFGRDLVLIGRGKGRFLYFLVKEYDYLRRGLRFTGLWCR